MKSFRQTYAFNDRREESSHVLKKYPERKPIICEKMFNQIGLHDIDKKKYLVPNEHTIGQFTYIIKKKLGLTSDEAVFLFINGKIISSSTTIAKLYYREKDPDGFLYISYSKENVFG